MDSTVFLHLTDRAKVRVDGAGRVSFDCDGSHLTVFPPDDEDNGARADWMARRLDELAKALRSMCNTAGDRGNPNAWVQIMADGTTEYDWEEEQS